MSRKNWASDKIFFRLLNNKSDKTYFENIRELRRRPDQEVFEKSYGLAMSGNDKEKEIGIDVLAQLGATPRPFYKPSVKLYFELLPTLTNPGVLYALLYAVSHNNEKLHSTQIAAISLFKNHADTNIRQAVVASLLGVDNTAAINILIELSNDKVISIRNWATFGLGSQIKRKGRNITAALWNRTGEKHQETRFEAIVGLAVRKDTRTKDLIKRELAAGEFGTLLFSAIEELGDIEFLPILKKLYKKSKVDDSISVHWLKALKNCIDEL
jgi:nucleoid DNA-binding protein